MYRLTAVFIGAFIAIMISFNSTLAKATNSMFSILVVHIVGLVAAGTIVLVKKENVRSSGRIPIYVFGAGIRGVLLTYLNNACIGALGVSLTLAFGLAGQSALSCIIDHFGFFGVSVNRFSSRKLIGFALIFCGAAVMALK